MATKNNDIVPVIRKILNSIQDIETIHKVSEEFYFEYPQGIFWSASTWLSDDDNRMYGLYLYPRYTGKLEDIAGLSFGADAVQFLSYVARYDSKSYDGLIPELYANLKLKYFNVADIFRKVLDS